jgi:hypothetical protein
MVNVELLEDTMKHIEENPQTWSQNNWYVWRTATGDKYWGVVTTEMVETNSCGSAYCFAGHAALSAGFSAPPKENYAGWFGQNGQYVDEFARETLGLTQAQADALFHGDNSMDDLRNMVDAIIENPKITGQALRELTDWHYDEDEDEDEEYDDEPCPCCVDNS